MRKLTKDRLAINFENTASGSFLTIGIDSDEKIIEYQVEMITSNTFEGILKFDLRHKNNTNYLYYNITSKIGLMQFLKRNKLKKNDFITIIQGVAKSLIESRNYFLYDKNFVIDKQYIYLDPHSLETKMVYLPFPVEGDATANYKDFLTELILNSADIEETTGDNFLQRILNSLKTETFNVYEFNKLLIELKNSKNSQPNIENYHHAQLGEKIISNEAVTRNQQQHNGGIEPKYKAEDEQPQRINIPTTPEGNPSKKQSVKPAANSSVQKKTSKMGYKTSSIVGFTAVQILIVILITYAAASGILVALGDDFTTTGLGIGIVVIAGDFLLFRGLFDSRNLVQKVVAQKKAVKIENKHEPSFPISEMDMSKKEIKSVLAFSKAQSTGMKAADSRSELKETKTYVKEIDADLRNSTTYLGDVGYYETTMLGNSSNKRPYLKGYKNGILEEIPIIKPNFFIGRLGQQVDYVSQNGAVGKIHAEIISMNGKCFLKDMNSRNGTFINDVKIDSNKEYEIHNNDEIMFATSKFTFVVP